MKNNRFVEIVYCGDISYSYVYERIKRSSDWKVYCNPIVKKSFYLCVKEYYFFRKDATLHSYKELEFKRI